MDQNLYKLNKYKRQNSSNFYIKKTQKSPWFLAFQGDFAYNNKAVTLIAMIREVAEDCPFGSQAGNSRGVNVKFKKLTTRSCTT